MSQPQYGSAQPPADYPGKTLGLVGLILAIVAPVIGLIVSLIARSQSKAVGMPNGKAKAGIIVAIVLIVLGIIIGLAIGIPAFQLISKCADLGPGTHNVDGVTLTCPS